MNYLLKRQNVFKRLKRNNWNKHARNTTQTSLVNKYSQFVLKTK